MSNSPCRIAADADPRAMHTSPADDCAGVQDDLVNRVIASLTGGKHDAAFQRRIEALLEFVRVERRQYELGPVRQVLMHIFRDPFADDASASAGLVRAALRVELRDGTLYPISISGVRCGLDRVIEIIGPWLDGQLFDERAFEQQQAELNRMLTIANDGMRVRLSFDVNAGVSIYPQVGLKMIYKTALSALNALLEKSGLAQQAELPQCLRDHFQYQCPTRHDAARRYLAALDKDVLGKVRLFRSEGHGQLGELPMYNYFAGNNSAHIRYRMQAVAVFPHLLPILLERANNRRHSIHREQSTVTWLHREMIERAVDEGRALFRSVAAAFSVPVETVQWLVGKALPVEWTIDSRRLALLLRLLSWVAPEKRPRNVEEFILLLRFGRAFAGALQFVGTMDNDAALGDRACTLAVRRWLSDLRAPGFEGAVVMAADGQFERDLADAKDFLAAVHQAVLLYCSPAAAASDVTNDACLRFVYDWARSRSYVQLLAASRQWHAALLPITQHDENELYMPSWPAVLDKPLRVGPVTVVELTHERSLVEEGQRLQHCVGGYRDRCASRDGLIFSVRDDKGMSCSTADIRLAGDPLSVSVIEHRGMRNGAPSDNCVAAIAALVAHLNRRESAGRLRERQSFQYRTRLREQHERGRAASAESAYTQMAKNAAMTVITKRLPPFDAISLSELYAMTGVPRLKD